MSTENIKSLSGSFYQCKAQYSMIDENGNDKKIKADYVVQAECCGEAETMLLEHLIPSFGDAEINQVSKGKMREIIYGEKEGGYYYEATLQLITFDEKSGKEKRSTIKYLICANDMMTALKGIQDFMSTSMVDFDSIQIKQTKIEDVISSIS